MIRYLSYVFLLFFLFSTAVFCTPSSEDILLAAKKNDIQAMNSYIQNGANLNCYDKDGFTPIMFASINNYVTLIRLLASRSDVNLNQRNSFGYSALTLAVVFGNTEIADILKKAGARE